MVSNSAMDQENRISDDASTPRGSQRGDGMESSAEKPRLNNSEMRKHSSSNITDTTPLQNPADVKSFGKTQVQPFSQKKVLEESNSGPILESETA